ncbi:MAG: hypothetical protein JWM99_5114, partial [Verrucomicrobiales bacterium]|nr:hypothetical protein [Verrucomicrobiales bacterium]
MHDRKKKLDFIRKVLLAFLLGSGPAVRAEVDPAESIRVVCAVAPEGKGNVEAAQAWQRLVKTDAAQLPIILDAMQGANDLAANWLRSA